MKFVVNFFLFIINLINIFFDTILNRDFRDFRGLHFDKIQANFTTIEVEHKDRFQGSSSYNFNKLVKLALQGLTSHSYKLLRLSIYFGFILALIAISLGMFVIIRYFTHNFNPGWPSIIVTILFSTGLILISLGIVGIYVGKILAQSKQHPVFVVQNEINCK